MAVSVKCLFSLLLLSIVLIVGCDQTLYNKEDTNVDIVPSILTSETITTTTEKIRSTKRAKSKSRKTTAKPNEDDDELDFSVFDKTPEERRAESQNNLGDSIVKAVKNFKRQNSQINLASVLSGYLGIRLKRSAPDGTEAAGSLPSLLEKLSDPDVLDALTKKPRKVDGNDIPDVPKQGEEDTFDFDEFLSDADGSDAKRDETTEKKKIEMTTSSNIHRIPKRGQILSRRPKSLHGGLLKNDLIVSNISDDEVDSWLTRDNLRNESGIQKYLEVYSAQRLVDNWKDVKKVVSPGCRRQMGQYLVGLTKHQMWALKMDDASGRYTAGYFWGNSYWSGSAGFCEHIALSFEESDDESQKGNMSAYRNGGMSHLPNYEMVSFTNAVMNKAPFAPTFFMAKMKLTSEDAAGGPRNIQLGLCLPSNCTEHDVHMMLETSRTYASPTIMSVRSPQLHYFNMFTDLTFQLLAGVSVVVLGLMIAGTLYELALGPRLVQQTAHTTVSPAARHCMPSTKPEGPPQAATVQVMPIVNMSNGKSIYSLNANNMSTNNNNSEERLNMELNPVEEATTLNIFSEVILSFSVISNLKTICDQSVGADTIPTIHGLRSISMAWVILGHSCIVAFKYSDNMELRKVVEKEFLFQTVTNGAFSVDTFFCISGILVSYIYFRTNAKGSLERLTQGTKGFVSGFLQFIGLLGYRFARLTAPYMFMLGVVEVQMKWFNSNSVFEPPTLDHINCPNYWWRNVLYINTLFPVEQMCMLWSWYLADDSQFYVVGAVILILAASHFKTAAGAFTLFLVSSWFTTGYIAWSNNHMPSTDDPLALFDKIYDKPWTRLGPYLIGMAAGWLLFKTNCRIRMSKWVLSLGWMFSTIVLLCLVYGLYNTQLSPIAAAAYSSLSHTAWAVAIAWIVVACSTGYGGYINSFLSATILYPFSRVTYCAYLVHPVVIRFLAMHIDHPMHLGKYMMGIIFLGQMVASFMLSFVISLAFEAPVVTMLKILAPNRRKKVH